MKAHECFHCKQWIEKDEPHDCWTTTEAALTADLSEELRDAWARLREACHFFVRSKLRYLELCLFLSRGVKGPQVRRVSQQSKVKFANQVRVRHRDEVEPPITDWMREAYELQDVIAKKRR